MTGKYDINFDEPKEEESCCLSFDDFKLLIRTKIPIWQRTGKVSNDFGERDNSMPLCFQLLDFNIFVHSPIDTEGSKFHHENDHHIVNGIRLYGVDANGTSICVHVYGYSPYFFASVPPNFSLQQIEDIRKLINETYFKKYKYMTNLVTKIVLVDLKTTASPLTTQYSQVLKVYVSEQRFVSSVADLMRSELKKLLPVFDVLTFEEEIDLKSKFLCDTNLHGCSWIDIPSKRYVVLSDGETKTTCSMEIKMFYQDIACKDFEPSYNFQIAPFRLLGFDIECYNRNNKLSDSDFDPVITIGNIVRDVQKKTDVQFNVIFALGNSKLIKDADLFCFVTEWDMLQSWKYFIKIIDPDAFVGYNIIGFDFSYLNSRAALLKIEDFGNFGKSVVYHEADKLYSKCNFEGRIIFDLLPIVKKELPSLSCYKLGFVSSHLINDCKDDIDASIIGQMYDRTIEDRQLIHMYCLKDALLPVKLLDHLNLFQKYVHMTQLTGLPFKFILRTCKVCMEFCCVPMLASAHELMLVLKKTLADPESLDVNLLKATSFFNINYANFESYLLFASITIEFNLCYCTFISNENVKKIPIQNYRKTPCGNFFFKECVHQGILPRMLLKLSAQLRTVRKQTKLKNDKKNAGQLYCRIVAIKNVLKSFPSMLFSNVSPYASKLIQKNIIAYYNDLNDQEKDVLSKKYFD